MRETPKLGGHSEAPPPGPRSARPEDRLRGEPGTHFPEACVQIVSKLVATLGIIRLRRFIEQRFGLLQIRGVEPLGEPTVEGSQKIARFGSPALVAAQPGEARRRTQLI